MMVEFFGMRIFTMFKLALISLTLLAAISCNDQHGHGPTPEWLAEVTIDENGITKTLPVLMDDFVSAIAYSPVTFHAEAPKLKGHVISRPFSLYGKGEQKVLTEVTCDTNKKGVAGEASMSLLGTTVKFYCKF